MAYRQDREQVFSGINVTPLTDVMLVLLITFLLSATTFESDSLAVPLPQVRDASEIEKLAVVLVVDRQGKPVWPAPDYESLPRKQGLVRLLRENGEKDTLALAIHRDCTYQKFFPVLREAGEAGWRRTLLLTEEPE